MGHFGVKATVPAWAANIKVGEHIPKELLDRLPVTTGELVTLEIGCSQKIYTGSKT